MKGSGKFGDFVGLRKENAKLHDKLKRMETKRRAQMLRGIGTGSSIRLSKTSQSVVEVPVGSNDEVERGRVTRFPPVAQAESSASSGRREQTVVEVNKEAHAQRRWGAGSEDGMVRRVNRQSGETIQEPSPIPSQSGEADGSPRSTAPSSARSLADRRGSAREYAARAQPITFISVEGRGTELRRSPIPTRRSTPR